MLSGFRSALRFLRKSKDMFANFRRWSLFLASWIQSTISRIISLRSILVLSSLRYKLCSVLLYLSFPLCTLHVHTISSTLTILDEEQVVRSSSLQIFSIYFRYCHLTLRFDLTYTSSGPPFHVWYWDKIDITISCFSHVRYFETLYGLREWIRNVGTAYVSLLLTKIIFPEGHRQSDHSHGNNEI